MYPELGTCTGKAIEKPDKYLYSQTSNLQILRTMILTYGLRAQDFQRESHSTLAAPSLRPPAPSSGNCMIGILSQGLVEKLHLSQASVSISTRLC